MKKEKTHSSKKGLHVTWLGHSAFLLEPPGGKRVLIDPWLDNPRAPSGAKEIAPVDIILVSHGHSDHLGNTVEVAKRTGATVVAIFEIALYLQAHGVENAVGINKGGTTTIDGVQITMVDAKHSSGIDDGTTVLPGGEAAGFIIRFPNGFVAYHAGDTSLFTDMKLFGKLYHPRAAFLPIGDLYTMGPRDAAMACQYLSPRHIIGMHYGTFPALTGTPEELRKHLPAKLRDKVRILEPGSVATLS